MSPVASTSSFSPVFSRKVFTFGIRDLISTRLSMTSSRSSFHLSSSTIFFAAAFNTGSRVSVVQNKLLNFLVFGLFGPLVLVGLL